MGRAVARQRNRPPEARAQLKEPPKTGSQESSFGFHTSHLSRESIFATYVDSSDCQSARTLRSKSSATEQFRFGSFPLSTVHRFDSTAAAHGRKKDHLSVAVLHEKAVVDDGFVGSKLEHFFIELSFKGSRSLLEAIQTLEQKTPVTCHERVYLRPA